MRPEAPTYIINQYIRQHYDFDGEDVSIKVDRIKDMIEYDGHGTASRSAILASIGTVRTERQREAEEAQPYVNPERVDTLSDEDAKRYLRPFADMDRTKKIHIIKAVRDAFAADTDKTLGLKCAKEIVEKFLTGDSFNAADRSWLNEPSPEEVEASKSIGQALGDVVTRFSNEIVDGRINGFHGAYGMFTHFLGELQAEGIIDIHGGIDLTWAAPRR